MNKQEFVEFIYSTKFLLVSALLLSAFTHLWNISQFPGIHVDEGHYIRRGLYVLNGLGPQESTSDYDHPFMGQILLAQFFSLAGFPNSFDPLPTVHSIETLFAFPRILMGILSIIDTFLVFLIGRYGYSKNVGIASSFLFAVMPMTWQLRRVVLDSIQIPFVLTSILFALIIKNKIKDYNHKQTNILVLLSGVFLGLAIFTKIPAIFITPLILYLIIIISQRKLKSSNQEHKQKRNILKNLGIWFIPVILIPLVWPAYAIWAGDFDKWTDGVLHQAVGRTDRSSGLWESFINIDPLLLILAVGGIIFSLSRKDFLPILWILPFILFVFADKWFASFHWNLLFPAFCIYAGLLLVELPNKIISIRRRQYVHISLFGFVIIFGFISLLLLLSVNVTSVTFEAAATSLQYLKSQIKGNVTANDFSVITSPVYTWLFKYPFEINNTINFRDVDDIKTQNVLLIIDGSFSGFMEPYEKILHPNASEILGDNDSKTRFVGRTIGSWITIDLGQETNLCSIKVSWYKGDSRSYNFSMSAPSGISNNSIVSYNSNGRTISEAYKVNSNVQRYLTMYFNGNTDNNIGSISEVALYGSYNASNSDECIKLFPKNIMLSNNSYIEAGDKRVRQIAQVLSEAKLISEISPTKKYDSHLYPYTSLKYSGTSSIEIRAK